MLNIYFRDIKSNEYTRTKLKQINNREIQNVFMINLTSLEFWMFLMKQKKRSEIYLPVIMNYRFETIDKT